MKLSIIICVYNTPKKYLEECLKSITESTVKDLGGDYEICMVDDGSSEDYSELIQHYGVRLTKTENRGIFSARRTGAKMARGEYSIYCDSDDTVSFNYYLPMLEKAQECGADIVINDWATRTEGGRYYAENDETICSNIDVFGEDALLYFVKNEGRQHSFYVLWNKLYKTSLLLSAFSSLNLAGFDESTSYSEDAALNFFLWKDAHRIVNIHTGFYFYRIHDNQTVTVASEKKLRSQIDSMTKTLEIMRAGTKGVQNESRILRHINEWSALMARAHYSQAKGAAYSELIPYIEEKYSVKKLKLSTYKDGAAYADKILLGDNFPEVEKALLNVYYSRRAVRCSYCKKDTYTFKSVEYMKKLGKVTDDDSAEEVVIPRFKIRLRKKLLNIPFVYKTSLVLFKKGSKARNFLKKFLK